MLVRLSFAFALLAAPLFAEGPQEDLAPFLDDQVIAVVRVRPDKVSAAVVTELDRKLTPVGMRDREGFQSPLLLLRDRAAEWTAAGGGDLYVVVSFQDVPRRMPFVILTPQAGKKADDLAAVVKRWDTEVPGEVIGNVIVLGQPETLARLKAGKPSERSDLLPALTAAPVEAIRVVVSPSAETRRVYRELLPPLPPGISAATSAELLEGAKLITAHLELSAEPAFKVCIQSQDAAAAEKWKETVTNAAAFFTQSPALQKEFPGLQKSAANPAPSVTGDRVEMVWGKDGERFAQLTGDILQPAWHKVYEQAAIAKSVNDLKQIMLAMHMYHDQRKTFPPQAIRDKKGGKLLSWRVAMLPYLEEKELYDQFHLDEAWDSEHNRKLIAKMPAVYASDLMPAGKRKPGFTPYVVPVAEGACFGGAEGTRLQDVFDGTSNTIAVVLATSSAVEWTKPADWEVDLTQAGKGWRIHPADPQEMLTCAFCDGSVQRIRGSITDEMIGRLLLIKDGNVIELPR